MKILMVSMFSPHFFNWAEQLKDSGHEIYWLDINDSNTIVKKIDFIHHIIGWRYKIDYPGRYLIKEKFPKLHRFINKFNERNLGNTFEKKLNEIQPDVVHSFVMYSACVPIFEIMKEFRNTPWVYSAWGNDLYYYQKEPEYLLGIKAVMPYLNYMFADCTRDFIIAKRYGFSGTYLGTFPGGGGYDLPSYTSFLSRYINRKLILIKGYQSKFGRCNNVLTALIKIWSQLQNFKIVVFGADKEVFDFVASSEILNRADNFHVLGKINHNEVLKLMGQSVLYMGNSISDGMPNTLLEAIIMETFPIQSNPGGATGEIIKDGKNGLLIPDPENSEKIANIILQALNDPEMRGLAVRYNNLYIKPKLEREYVKKHVLEKYKRIEFDYLNKRTL